MMDHNFILFLQTGKEHQLIHSPIAAKKRAAI
jgi:hypothetical protein